jgi:hypothetical protein
MRRTKADVGISSAAARALSAVRQRRGHPQGQRSLLVLGDVRGDRLDLVFGEVLPGPRVSQHV